MIKTLKIGKIVKPQGVNGEVKVYPYVDEIAPFTELKSVFLDGKNVKIAGARVSGSDVFISFEGVKDRNVAETLRGKELSLSMDEARVFASDGYFILELIGLDVCVGDNIVGKIKEVLKNGAADVFVVDGERPFMIPFLKKLTLSVDIDGGKIVFDEKVFKEVVVYED